MRLVTIGGWDISSVTDMTWMFQYNSAFNQDLGGWDTRNVTDMDGMFFLASAFNQDLGAWDISSLEMAVEMLDGSGLNNRHYDALLSGWAVISSDEAGIPLNVVLGAGGRSYTAVAAAAHARLVDDYRWTISGDWLVYEP